MGRLSANDSAEMQAVLRALLFTEVDVLSCGAGTCSLKSLGAESVASSGMLIDRASASTWRPPRGPLLLLSVLYGFWVESVLMSPTPDATRAEAHFCFGCPTQSQEAAEIVIARRVPEIAGHDDRKSLYSGIRAAKQRRTARRTHHANKLRCAAFPQDT